MNDCLKCAVFKMLGRAAGRLLHVQVLRVPQTDRSGAEFTKYLMIILR